MNSDLNYIEQQIEQCNKNIIKQKDKIKYIREVIKGNISFVYIYNTFALLPFSNRIFITI